VRVGVAAATAAAAAAAEHQAVAEAPVALRDDAATANKGMQWRAGGRGAW